MKNCIICGNEIIDSKVHLETRKTCSRKCVGILFKTQLAGENNPNYKNAGIKNCNFCGKEYKSYNKKSKYCSHICSDTSQRINPECNRRQFRVIKRKVRIKKIYLCSICNIKQINRKNKYCKECNRIKNKIKIKCKNCGLIGYSYKIRIKSFCSEECKFDFYKGEGNPNYIDGRTPENQKIRHSKPYAKWRLEVFKRDDYTCVFCGKVGGELNADHIKPFSKFPALRLVISNGRTLCKPCHEKTPTYRNNKNIDAVNNSGGIGFVARSTVDVIDKLS